MFPSLLIYRATQSLRFSIAVLSLMLVQLIPVVAQGRGDTGGLSRGADRVSPAGAIATIRSNDRLWQVTGPFGGDVTTLVIDPRRADRLLAGTSDGQLYQSVDGGHHWKNVNPGPGLPGHTVTAILFDRHEPRTIYVSLKSITALTENDRGGGLFVSEDDGVSWRGLKGLAGRPVRGVAQSSRDPRVLAVTALDGVYRSRDRGQTWERISPEGHPEMRGFHSIAIDPRSSSTIYAGTSHLPWKTTDDGRTWRLAGSSQTGMLDDSDVFSIQIDETNPDTILLSACSGIYRSFDGSATWTKFNGIPTASRRTQTIYRHPTRPEVIFAGTTEGLWMSKFYGMPDSWRRVTSEHLLINSVAIHPERPERIFLATEDGGVLISHDGGETWSPGNDGFINRQVGAVMADLGERGRIYAGILFDGLTSGIFISTDGGLTWRHSVKGMGHRDVYSLYQSPFQTGTIYAGTNDGIYRSDDRGENWQPLRKRVETTPVKQTSPIRTPRPLPRRQKPRGRHPVVATSLPAKAPRASSNDGLNGPRPVERIDLRNQVFAIHSFTPRQDLLHPAPPMVRQWLLASTWDGLYLTDDEANGWRKVSVHGPGGRRDPHIKTVAISHQAPGLIFIGTEEGLYQSIDNGQTFQRQLLGEEHLPVRTITFDPRTARTIYAGTTGGFFRSLDGGRSWEQRGGGMPLHTNASFILINELNPDEIHLADDLRATIYHSTDRGENWERLDLRQLPSTLFRTLSGDPFDPRRIYLGTVSGGVYVLSRNLE